MQNVARKILGKKHKIVAQNTKPFENDKAGGCESRAHILFFWIGLKNKYWIKRNTSYPSWRSFSLAATNPCPGVTSPIPIENPWLATKRIV